MRLGGWILGTFVIAMVIPAVAQQQAAPVVAFEFDVASVRPFTPPSSGSIKELLPAPTRVLPGDRFETGRWLRSTIEFAYGFERQFGRVKGGGQILDEMFVISARGAAGSFAKPSPDRLEPVRHMVQRLLAERFNLQTHFEQEERRVLLLKRASPDLLGPALHPLSAGCANMAATFPEDIPPPDSKLPRCGWAMPAGTLTATGVTFRDFARDISVWLGQEVVDETGLTGVYAFQTTFDKGTVMLTLPRLPGVQASGNGELPSFKSALKSDLGLVLEEASRPVPVLVITHIDALREN